MRLQARNHSSPPTLDISVSLPTTLPLRGPSLLPVSRWGSRHIPPSVHTYSNAHTRTDTRGSGREARAGKSELTPPTAPWQTRGRTGPSSLSQVLFFFHFTLRERSRSAFLTTTAVGGHSDCLQINTAPISQQTTQRPLSRGFGMCRIKREKP